MGQFQDCRLEIILVLRMTMEVFSPLVDVQPITPSVGSFWDNREDLKKQGGLSDNSSSIDELGSESYLTFDRRLSTKHEDSLSKVSSSQLATPTPGISLKGDRSPSVTPPEAWGGDLPNNRFNLRQQVVHNISRFASSTPSDPNSVLLGAVSSNSQDMLTSTTSGSADYPPSVNFNTSQVTGAEFANIENAGTSEALPVLPVSGISSTLGSKSIIVPSNSETFMNTIFPKTTHLQGCLSKILKTLYLACCFHCILHPVA
jgi:protein NEDD1